MTTSLRTLGVIPARLASTRLPRKVLREVAGHPLLAWVVEAARACPQLDQVLVAADTEAENPSLEDKASPAASMAARSPDAPAIEVVASPTAPERPLDPVNAFAVDPTLSASVPFAVVKSPTLEL